MWCDNPPSEYKTTHRYIGWEVISKIFPKKTSTQRFLHRIGNILTITKPPRVTTNIPARQPSLYRTFYKTQTCILDGVDYLLWMSICPSYQRGKGGRGKGKRTFYAKYCSGEHPKNDSVKFYYLNMMIRKRCDEPSPLGWAHTQLW